MMAERDDHLGQARLNSQFARDILASNPSPAGLQWAVTAAFYAGLHYIEAHLAAFGVHNTTHVARKNTIAQPQYGTPPGVYSSFERLRNKSNEARYFGRQFSFDEVKVLLEDDLGVIESFVGS